MESPSPVDDASSSLSTAHRRETQIDPPAPTSVDGGSSAERCSKCSKTTREALEEVLGALDAGRLDLAREELQRMTQVFQEDKDGGRSSR